MAEINKLPADTTDIKTKTGETVEVKINTTENAVTVDNDATNPAYVRLKNQDFNEFDLVAVKNNGYEPLNVSLPASYLVNNALKVYLDDTDISQPVKTTGSDKVTVNGMVSIANTVGISNTSFGITGATTSNNALNVSVSNTPSVNANVTFPQTQNVSFNGTAQPISGTVNANVTFPNSQNVSFNGIKQPTFLIDANTANEANINSDGTLDVRVSNLPTTQNVSFNDTKQPVFLADKNSANTVSVSSAGLLSVAVGNFPDTVSVKTVSTDTVAVTGSVNAAITGVTVANNALKVDGSGFTQPVSLASTSITNTAFGIDQTTANANNVQLVRKNKSFARFSTTTTANTVETLVTGSSGQRIRVFFISASCSTAPASGSIQFFGNTSATYDSTTEFLRVSPNASAYFDKIYDFGVDGFALDASDGLYFRTTTQYTNNLILTIHYVQE